MAAEPFARATGYFGPIELDLASDGGQDVYVSDLSEVQALNNDIRELSLDLAMVPL